MTIGTRLSILVIASWGLAAIFAPLFPLSANELDLKSILHGPSFDAWLGHDDLGRSIGARLIHGCRTSFFVALGVVSVTSVLGTLIGVIAAWRGGLVDVLVLQVVNLFLAFPGILLAILLAGLLGPGLGNVIFALAAVGWVGFARLARAQVLTLREREHVQAGYALGSGPLTIIRWHVLPLILAPLLVEASFGIAAVIVAEAGLSFLGLGVQPPTPSWGSMIRDGAQYMLVAPHMVAAPSVAVMLVVVTANSLGDRLRDAMDVRRAH